jgi:IS605 OrfB family transposase
MSFAPKNPKSNQQTNAKNSRKTRTASAHTSRKPKVAFDFKRSEIINCTLTRLSQRAHERAARAKAREKPKNLQSFLITFAESKLARKRKGGWDKKSRKRVNRIPYALFRHALKCVAEREGVPVKEAKPNYTSQTCPRCGHISRENWRRYIYFKRVKCCYEADRDHVASLNIAFRATQNVGVSKTYFLSQNPEGDASVSRHVLKGEGCGRQRQTTPGFKLTDLSVGG